MKATSNALVMILTMMIGATPTMWSSPLWAQSGPNERGDPVDAPKRHSTRLILLGTNGGPSASTLRSEPANLLVVDGTPYLVDAGPGVDRQIAAAGFKHADIRAIFITHHHIDHNGGLVPLISLIWFDTAWHNRPMPPVEIYGPPATEFLVHTALGYLSVSERIFRAGVPELVPAGPMFHAHDIDSDGQFYEDARIRVTSAENSHFHFRSEDVATGEDRSYSYRFDTPDGSVVFTGDTGPSDAATKLAQGADVLVSEVCACNDESAENPPPILGSQAALMREQEQFHMTHEHLTPEEVGKMASRAHVKVVILSHFVPGEDVDMTRFTAGVTRYFSGPVIPGQDLFEYDIR
jgi:ribonuclease BN (tRNA processing enzyme)